MTKPTSPKFAASLVHAATVLPLLHALVRMRRERAGAMRPASAPARELAA